MTEVSFARPRRCLPTSPCFAAWKVERVPAVQDYESEQQATNNLISRCGACCAHYILIALGTHEPPFRGRGVGGHQMFIESLTTGREEDGSRRTLITLGHLLLAWCPSPIHFCLPVRPQRHQPAFTSVYSPFANLNLPPCRAKCAGGCIVSWVRSPQINTFIFPSDGPRLIATLGKLMITP